MTALVPLGATLGAMVLACGVLFAVAAVAGLLAAGLMATNEPPPRQASPRVDTQEVMTESPPTKSRSLDIKVDRGRVRTAPRLSRATPNNRAAR